MDTQAIAPADAGHKPTSTAAERPCVLLVDDDEILLAAYHRTLARAGYEVSSVSRPVRALEALGSRSFDVVVSDVSMPGGMSGIDLVERARGDGIDVPFVLVTGTPNVETAMRAVRPGVVRYLAKPVDPGLLLQVVAAAMRAHGAERAKQLALDNEALCSLIDELERAREAAGVAARAKREFLSKISHELLTPMAQILGFAELALDCEEPVEARGHMLTVKRSGDELHGLLRRLLDFAQLNQDRVHLTTLRFDLRETMTSIMDSYAERARSRGLSLECSVAEGIPEAVLGDGPRLRQVIDCLLNNAVRFTCRGGARVQVEHEASGDGQLRLRFVVFDTGPGISRDALARVTDAFVQADDSATRAHGGVGLGLTIASKLVDLMGGSMSIESTPTQGTAVTFTVPVAEAPPPRATR
ncbi:MAG: ATP-binding protein [Polyangiaceae bacterium]